MQFAQLILHYWPSLLGIACMGMIVWRWPRFRGTTLVAPAIWSFAALTAVVLAEGLLRSSGQSENIQTRRAVHYFLGVTCLCPAMALFGAKRPQDSAWQFIVFSLWIVLSLPSIHWWLAGGGEPFGIHIAQAWFVCILWLTTAANHLFTRYAIASLLISLGQFIYLQAFLPLTPWLPSIDVNAIVFLAAGILAAFTVLPRRQPTAVPFDLLWLDFRDSFGAVWGLRVQQRVNQSAIMYGWKLRLDWSGFQLLDGNALSEEILLAVKNNLNNSLRRFVSPQWIARRTNATPVTNETKS